jgi:hypothetical protein
MNAVNRAVFDVSRFGARLGTRLEGEAARGELLAALERLPTDGQLVVSLGGVDVLSGSFADELIGKACQLLASGIYEQRTMIVSTPSLDLTEDLSGKLTQRRLAMLCTVDGRRHVLGTLAEPLLETLELLVERTHATARELADALEIPSNACHNRLRRLVDLHLIRQERIGVSSPKTQYRFHSILIA